MNMKDSLEYIGEAYLSRVKLALIGLDYLDSHKDDQSKELLAIEPFSRPLYELLYAAIVTGVEDYLRIRLKHEVTKSEDRMRKYLNQYNYNYRRKRDRQISSSKESVLSNETKERLLDTLDSHVYHRLDLVAHYFEAVAGVNLPKDTLWNQMLDIIHTRHIIIHEGGKLPCGNRIELTPYAVHKALEAAERFIQQAEDLFYEKGNGYLYDIPSEK